MHFQIQSGAPHTLVSPQHHTHAVPILTCFIRSVFSTSCQRWSTSLITFQLTWHYFLLCQAMAVYHPLTNLLFYLSTIFLHSFLDLVAGVRNLTRASLLGFLHSLGLQVFRSIFLALIKKDTVNRNRIVGFPGADCNPCYWLIDKSAKSLFQNFYFKKMSPLLKYKIAVLVQSLFFVHAAIYSAIIV